MLISTRRLWMRGAAAFCVAPALAEKKGETDDAVSPAEDLMREHGVLKRVLLVYRHIIGRIDDRKGFPPEALFASAKLIRAFVEDYHEKLEEDYLFPRFRKANRLVDLVEVLQTQHQRGRVLTDRIILLANAAALRDASQAMNLRSMLHQFVRMYEPHEAREDTVLFPAFRKIVSGREYDALGEEFEKKENELFHGEGFEKNVDAVTHIEKQLGLYDLAQFTPNV